MDDHFCPFCNAEGLKQPVLSPLERVDIIPESNFWKQILTSGLISKAISSITLGNRHRISKLMWSIGLVWFRIFGCRPKGQGFKSPRVRQLSTPGCCRLYLHGYDVLIPVSIRVKPWQNSIQGNVVPQRPQIRKAQLRTVVC